MKPTNQLIYIPTHLHEQDVMQGQFLNSLTGLNPEFSLFFDQCLCKG